MSAPLVADIEFTNQVLSHSGKSVAIRESNHAMGVYNFIYNRLFCCNHTCYCVNIVSVTPAASYITSASRYHPGYQSRSSIYIGGLIPQIFPELAKVLPIGSICELLKISIWLLLNQS